MTTPRFALVATTIVVIASLSLAADKLPPPADRKIDFAKDVRPLLEKHCWKCHGAEKQESGLRLDSRAALLKGGDIGQVIAAEDSERSKLILLVSGTDPQTVMPPDGPQLKPAEVGILRAWIDQGCVWPDGDAPKETKNTHWAYQPIRRVAPPAVKKSDWVRNPIDQFVLAELEKRGISPSPEADRSTLIRRLNLDLLGLPPTIEEVDTFVNDSRPNAYEDLVDRLLKSPHFGERWGRHWLDMARYADSDGYEKDNPRPDAFRWRDWVIDAINNDLPFDQFTVEQIAGDLLPNTTAMQKLATAFHRQTLTNTEGGTDKEQWRVEACFDRTETTGAVWLGLTVGCARCHSHKYDAISQREYYQLFAAYNNGDEETAVVPKSPEEVAAYAKTKAAHDAEVSDVTVKLRAEQAKLGEAFAAWETKAQVALADSTAQPLKLHALDGLKVESDGNVKFAAQKDGSFLASGPNPNSAVYTITGKTTVAGVSALRLDVLPDNSLPAKGPGRVAHGNFVLSEMTIEVSPTADFANARKLEFAGAKADFEQADKPWRAIDVIDGKVDTGWAVAPQYGKEHWAIFALKEPLALDGSAFVRVQLRQLYGQQHTIGRFKLSLQTGIEPSITLPENVQKLLAIKLDQRSAEQKQQLLDYYSSLDAATKTLVKQLDDLKKKEPPKPELTVRVILQRAKDPRKTFVLRRGEFLEPLTEQEVVPAAFSTLPPMKPRDEKSTMADRLDLARWLVSPDNPLTSRVTVNHIWRQLFGRGIVASVNDFGIRGEKPSHPELLDWLAVSFRDGDKTAQPWSRKALLKLIVTSATYRQASRHRPELLDVDPQNTLLARQNRLRVEAEIVRDLSLDVGGLLSKKIGGPSVFPALPAGITDLSYAGNFKWTNSTGEDRNRRGMYTFFKRTAPHPNLTTFDCPDANLTCVERRASNTPLQALITLNNETFLEASQAFAKRLLSQPASDDAARLTQAFRLCLARTPSDRELHQLTDLLSVNREFYRAHQDDAKKLNGSITISGVSPDETAAWIATARILLNLDEFITRE
ncbi:MAG: PSD1 domain-containing protein [Planctomycetaceae bacterium]|nr:PSD1 domain-containing protein [Planctomycetaceae bacterium]